MSIKKKVSTKGLFNYGQDIVMAFLPSVVGCLVKKRLTKGGSRAPQDPPGYAVVNGSKLIATRCPAFCPNTTTSPWWYDACIVLLGSTWCITRPGFFSISLWSLYFVQLPLWITALTIITPVNNNSCSAKNWKIGFLLIFCAKLLLVLGVLFFRVAIFLIRWWTFYELGRLGTFLLKPGFHIVVSVVSVARKKFIGQIQLFGNLP